MEIVADPRNRVPSRLGSRFLVLLDNADSNSFLKLFSHSQLLNSRVLVMIPILVANFIVIGKNPTA